MLTLAFAQIVWAICFKWNEVTGGEQGMPEIPYPDFGWVERLGAVVPLLGGWRTAEYFYFADARPRRRAASGRSAASSARRSGACSRRSGRTRSAPSSSGSTCAATSSPPSSSPALFAGLAGGLFGIFNRGVFPDFAYWTKSSEVLIMTLLGGMGTFYGPARGRARAALAQPADRLVHGVLAADPRRHPGAPALRLPGRASPEPSWASAAGSPGPARRRARRAEPGDRERPRCLTCATWPRASTASRPWAA